MGTRRGAARTLSGPRRCCLVTVLRVLWSRLAGLFLRRRWERELEEEIQFHLDSLGGDKRRFGNSGLIQELARDRWSWTWLELLRQDARVGARAVLRARWPSAITIATLALAIGATTAIYSVVDAALLRPLPYPHGDRLVWLGESTPKAAGISVSWGNFRQWRAQNHAFETLAGFETAHLTLTGAEEPSLIRAGVVTPEFFALTGARLSAGRLFDASDDRPNSEPVAVLASEFNLAPSAVGSILNLNGQPHRVIGIRSPSTSTCRSAACAATR